MSYETLQIIWWGLIGCLLVGFLIMDGHDMGVGLILPWVTRQDDERRVVINTIGPHWEGNQVWLILAAGGVFAAWPEVYGVIFSYFYGTIFLMLFGLFFRPVAFDYRNKFKSYRVRQIWDWFLFSGSCIPPFMMGVLLGNILQGVDFALNPDHTLMLSSHWNFGRKLYPLLCGFHLLVLLIFHGSVYLSWRTEGALQSRVERIFRGSVILLVILYLGQVFWFSQGLLGYHVEPNGNVTSAIGLWLNNFSKQPWLWLLPLGIPSGMLLAYSAIKFHWQGLAFLGSSIVIMFTLVSLGIMMFPIIVPSSAHLGDTLTLSNSSASQHSLGIMFGVTVFFIPVIVFYTSWAYRVLAGKVTVAMIQANDHTMY